MKILNELKPVGNAAVKYAVLGTIVGVSILAVAMFANLAYQASQNGTNTNYTPQ